jgi:hypothetical protein
MIYLALRHTDTPGVLGLFSKYTRWRLHTRYPHAGIVIDGVLYESTFSKGVSSRDFVPDGWDLYEMTNLNAQEVMRRFTSVRDRPYDWFSLLAFVLPGRASVSQWFYCFELCWYLMYGTSPNHRVTPENLLIGVLNANKIGSVGLVC